MKHKQVHMFVSWSAGSTLNPGSNLCVMIWCNLFFFLLTLPVRAHIITRHSSLLSLYGLPTFAKSSASWYSKVHLTCNLISICVCKSGELFVDRAADAITCLEVKVAERCSATCGSQTRQTLTHANTFHTLTSTRSVHPDKTHRHAVPIGVLLLFISVSVCHTHCSPLDAVVIKTGIRS